MRYNFQAISIFALQFLRDFLEYDCLLQEEKALRDAAQKLKLCGLNLVFEFLNRLLLTCRRANWQFNQFSSNYIFFS